MKLLIFLPVFLLLIACEEKSERKILFKEVKQAERDSTLGWFLQKPHFHLEEYDSVFTDYYYRKLKQKDYTSAARALEITSEHQTYYSDFSEELFHTIENFQRRYSRFLPKERITFLNSYIGNYYTDQGDFKRAIPYFRSITSRKPVDFYSCSNIAYAYVDMAFCYSSIGDQKSALRQNVKALKYFNQTDDLSGRGNVYNNLSVVCLFTKDYGQAEAYLDKAINDFKRSKDTTNIFTGLYNKILLYENMGHKDRFQLIDSNYRYFNTCKIKDPSIKISVYTYYVQKLIHDGKLKEAQQMLNDLEPEVASLNSTFSTSEYVVARAEFEVAANREIMNTALIEQALQVFEENEHYQMMYSYAEVLKDNAVLKKDYKKALIYSEKAKEAAELLATEKMSVKAVELDRKHQAEKKQHQIDLQKEAILTKNVIIWMLIFALFGFLLTLLIVQNWQKQKKIRFESIKAKQFTRQLLEKTEEERKRIAGDLHDSVSHELLSLKNSINENHSESGAKIDAIINDIRIISRNLHPIMFEKVGLAASIQQLVERMQSVYDLMVTADIDYNGFLPTADELQIYRIIQEALSNTIKYADAYAAKIVLLMYDNGLHILIKDNGKGFNVSEKLSTSSAFGLHNILERSKAIGGEPRITSDSNGTVITIDIRKQP